MPDNGIYRLVFEREQVSKPYNRRGVTGVIVHRGNPRKWFQGLKGVRIERAVIAQWTDVTDEFIKDDAK